MRRKILGLMTAFVAAFGLIIAPVSAQAAGLTQITDTGKVKYGTLTEAEKQIISTLFDLEYYKKTNPELVEKLGDSYQALFDHFCNYGIFEGRTCNPNFDPSVYASAYEDVKKECKDNIVAYYIHYATIGINEDRPIATLDAAARNNITVISLIDSSIVITPEIYRIAKFLGTTDYAKASSDVAKAAYLAAISGQSVVVNTDSGNAGNDEGNVIAVPEEDVARIEALGLKPIGTLKVNGSRTIYIYASIGEEISAAIYDQLFIQQENHQGEANPFVLTGDEKAAMAAAQNSCIDKTEGFNTNDQVIFIGAANIGVYDYAHHHEFIGGIPDEGTVICSLIEPNPVLVDYDNMETEIAPDDNTTQIEIDNNAIDAIYDQNGNANTEYTTGVAIAVDNDNPTIHVGFGVVNGENDFETVADCTVPLYQN